MTDYPELYRQLAREILKHEGKIEGGAKQFSVKLAEKLRAQGYQLTPEIEAQLSDYLASMQGAIRTGIEAAVVVAAKAAPTLPQSAMVATLTEQAFNQRWPDGLKLSDRLWNWDQTARQGLTNVLRDAVKTGASVNKTVYDMQRTIERAHGGQRFKIVEQYADDWVKELHDAATQMIHDPGARELWNATVADVEERVLGLKATGTRHAAERVFDQIKLAVSKGREELADKAVKWWLYDKQLYGLKRIARTEMATAMHQAVITGTEADDSIIGYQWRLSASHPITDICDYYANVEMGLGKGVFTKDAVPHHKAHPHCMCWLIPRVTQIKQKGSKNYADWLKNLAPEKRADVLPGWIGRLHKLGVPFEQLIRGDGLGPVTRQGLMEQLGQERFSALNALATAQSNRNWGSRSFKNGSAMTRRTVAEFEPFKDVPAVKQLLDDIQAGNKIDGLALKYLKRRYPEGEAITRARQIDQWFEAVLSDPTATIGLRANDNSRYAVHSMRHRLLAIIEPNGQRVSVYSHDGTNLAPQWLTLNQLTQTTN